jgi:hypothetical protein
VPPLATIVSVRYHRADDESGDGISHSAVIRRLVSAETTTITHRTDSLMSWAFFDGLGLVIGRGYDAGVPFRATCHSALVVCLAPVVVPRMAAWRWSS